MNGGLVPAVAVEIVECAHVDAFLLVPSQDERRTLSDGIDLRVALVERGNEVLVRADDESGRCTALLVQRELETRSEVVDVADAAVRFRDGARAPIVGGKDHDRSARIGDGQVVTRRRAHVLGGCDRQPELAVLDTCKSTHALAAASGVHEQRLRVPPRSRCRGLGSSSCGVGSLADGADTAKSPCPS
jgi:hypothetical protein